MPYTPFTNEVLKIIKSISAGKILTYGKIALLAGSPRDARQVSRILHTLNDKENLPWYRVVNSQGKIVINNPKIHEMHLQKLEQEGIEILPKSKIDLNRYIWDGH